MRIVPAILCVALLAVNIGVARQAKGSKAKPVPKELQAAWMVEGWTVLGENKTVAATMKPGRGVTITEGKAQWTDMPGALKAGKGTITVDAAAKPPRIELKTDKATYKGVYELDMGYLLITFSAPGGDYPKQADWKVDQTKEFSIGFHHPAGGAPGAGGGEKPESQQPL